MIQRFQQGVRLIENVFLVGLLSALIVLAAYQVIARNFFDSGILWGDAFVRVSVLWITMVGAMLAARADDHIRIDLLSRFVSDERSRWLRRLPSAFAFIICSIFAYYSYELVRFEYVDQTIAFASVPAWVCELIMPVAGLVMAIRYFLHTISPP